MLSPSDVTELIHDRLYPLFVTERERLAEIELWASSEHKPLPLPPNASREQKDLRDLARTPWLSLVSMSTTQAQVVDGYYSPDIDPENDTAWSSWEVNDFDAKQVAIHKATNDFGYCYVKAVPGEVAGERRAKYTPVDPSHAIAVWNDPVEDEWPVFVLQGEPRGKQWLMRLYDDEHEHFVSMGVGDKPEYVEWREHGVGVTPFVRYAPMMDLRGRAVGQVEPFINVAKRLNKNVHDRLLAQHYNSWKIRYATGIDLGKGLKEPTADSTIEEWNEYRAEVERRRIKLGQSEMLVARDENPKFGTLDETALEGYVRVDESDRETLAAVTQTPATTLTGKVSNLSAEAIAEIRAGWRQKVGLLNRGLGKSHNQLLRLGSHIEGDEAAANDFRGHVSFADIEISSISQAADAFTKIADGLKVPPQALWKMLPGVEKVDIDEWESMASQGDSIAALTAYLESQANTGL